MCAGRGRKTRMSGALTARAMIEAYAGRESSHGRLGADILELHLFEPTQRGILPVGGRRACLALDAALAAALR